MPKFQDNYPEFNNFKPFKQVQTHKASMDNLITHMPRKFNGHEVNNNNNKLTAQGSGSSR